MAEPGASLSPRQRECLQLIYDRQLTSKEIAAELGISVNTVSGYISEAVELLGARDRRDAARMVFGGSPREDVGGQSARVPAAATEVPPAATSTTLGSDGGAWPRPWRSRNTLSPTRTLIAIAIAAMGSVIVMLVVVALGSATSVLAAPLLQALDRLTR